MVPDLVTCGKGMTGGYMPVGAVLASERIVAALAKTRLHPRLHVLPQPGDRRRRLETLDILERRGPRGALAGPGREALLGRLQGLCAIPTSATCAAAA